MKKTAKLLLFKAMLCIALLAFYGPAAAAEGPGAKDVKFTPSLKFSWFDILRFENKTYPGFVKDGPGKRNFWFNLSKLSAEQSLSPECTLNFGVRDFRFFDRQPASNAGISMTNFELSLLNLRFEEFLGNKRLKATIGLQESVCKECRVMGLGNWIIGRLWQGVRLTYYDTPAETLDFFNFEQKRADNDPPSQSRGFYYFNEKKGCEIYIMNKVDRRGTAGEIPGRTPGNIDIKTLGYKQNVNFSNRLQAKLEAAAQLGSYGPDDHSARAFHAQIKYSTLSRSKYAVTLEYNEASGDDAPNDGKHGTFDNLYPANYGKYGYMDYMSWQNMKQICLSNSFALPKGFTARVNLHRFTLASASDGWYNSYLVSQARDATGAAGKDIGSEINFIISKKVDDSTDIEFGTSKFDPGSYIRNINAPGKEITKATWTFFQLTKKASF